jgi:2-haloacid dehalogenase
MGVIALDVYGTVVDPAGIVHQLSKRFGVCAKEAACLWREKQLEFTFRRGLMRRYADFDVCTAQALKVVSAYLGVTLSEAEERGLLDSWLHLPAFTDVMTGLEMLKKAGHELVALTNGTERSVRGLLANAGIIGYFEAILSADRVGTFKPDPAVYALLNDARERDGNVWLVSGNPFDVIGAKACGLKAAWLRRDPQRVFDPWEFSPDAVVRTLDELSGELNRVKSL